MKRDLLNVFLLSIILFSWAQITYCKEASTQVRIGVLPIMDVLPVYVAKENGYFEQEGIKAEIIPCASAAERDQLLVAGSLDIIVNDLLSIALFNREKVNVIGVRYAMVPDQNFFQFAIVASKSSKITKPSDLKGVPIGVSYATIIHYVTERLLNKEGLKHDEIKTVQIPRIPDRLSALMRGDLKAACLPDPFASLSVMQGANLILDDRKNPSFSGSIYSVSRIFAEKNPELLKKFLLSVDKAIGDINREKQKWLGIALDKKLLPSILSGQYVIPNFPRSSIPDHKMWDDVISWLREKNLIRQPVQYSESITGKFLRR